MRHRSLVLSLVLSLLGFVVAQAQTGSSKPISLPHHSPSTPQGLEGGFWRTDQNFDPILRLKNVLLKQSLSVTPALYFADGTEYDLPAMTLEPAGVAQVNIRLALENAPATIQSHASTYGMAGISYQWSWPVVIATIQNTDEIASLTITSSFRSDVRTVHANPEAAQAQAVRGSWWLPTPDSDGFLVLENSSLSSKQVDVRFSDHAGNQMAEQQVTLPSHGTSFLKFSSIFGDLRGSETMGGVDVRYTGPKYGILVYGGIVDETHGYSASPIMMEDHLDANRPAHNVALSVPGLLLGNADPAMEFPTGTYFKPYALLHNLSAQALQVSLDLTSQGSSGEPQTVPLAPVSLAPGQVLQYDFSSQFGKSNPLPDGYGSLTASFQGRDGDLQIHAGSLDQSENYVFEVPASQQADSASRTLCFWSIEGDNDSMITVWNYKATPQDLLLTLRYSGGQYVLPLHLAARQSYNLDMLSLVRSQVPDANGTLIPSNIASGSGTLASAGGEDKEISIAMASSVFNVRNATCGSTCYTCDGATQTAFLPSPLSVPVGGTHGAQFQITWDTGSVYTNPGGSSWRSGNTSIATVDSNGNVTGRSAGQIGVNVQLNSYPVYANICSADHAAPCPQPPIGGGGNTDVASLSCTQVTRAQTVTCTASGSSGATFSGWRFVDAAGNTVTSNSTGSQWSGTAVQSGTVSVTVTGSDGSASSPSATIAVSNRTNFSFTAVSPHQETNPYTCTSNSGTLILSVNNPPQNQGTNEETLGQYCDIEDYSYNFATISSGPNQGYSYITGATNNASFHWIIAQDVQNPSSTFYQKQCGNYNAGTNAGFIGGAQLNANTVRHESGIVEGHYGQYVTSQNDPNNNVGTGLETAVNFSTGQTFQNWVSSYIAPRVTAITNKTRSPEPYDVNHDQNGVYNGPINFSPYAPCQ